MLIVSIELAMVPSAASHMDSLGFHEPSHWLGRNPSSALTNMDLR